MKLSLLILKLLVVFPRIAEALRGLLDDYEKECYRRRHSRMRGVVDAWMLSDSPPLKTPRVYREAGQTSIHDRGEEDLGDDATLHKRLREQPCPVNEKDCLSEKSISPKKED